MPGGLNMKIRIARLLAICLALTACASGGFNSIEKTAQLHPGMSFEEVTSLLGPPKETVMDNGRRVATFWLHQEWRGNVPLDLVFTGRPERLESWSENKAKFEASQDRLAEITKVVEQSGMAGNTAAPAGPNDPDLQRRMAGQWWGYSGSTERTIGLCANGDYFDSQESSYSGQSTDQYGDQTMAWGQAGQGGGQGRWTISGDPRSGTIHVAYGDGSSRNIGYRQIDDPGCRSFDGNTLCRKSAACR